METLPFGLITVFLLSACLLHSAIVTTATKSCDVDSPDVRSIDIRLPLINVPAARTFYVCQQFPVPNDTEYHAIAFEPIIYNKDLIHHMILFGCPFHIEDLKPHPCGRLDNKCNTWLVQWSVGMEERICTPPSGGVPFGKNIFSFLSIQVHWNNDGEELNITATTCGETQVYIYSLKISSFNDVNVLDTTGNNGKSIASAGPEYALVKTGSTEGYMRLYRNGTMVQEIAHDLNYTYTTSPVHHLQNGVRIDPGDEIRVTCVYNTLTEDRLREETISFGEGSDAEMCYAFVTYFPAVEKFSQCIQLDDFDVNC